MNDPEGNDPEGAISDAIVSDAIAAVIFEAAIFRLYDRDVVMRFAAPLMIINTRIAIFMFDPIHGGEATC